MDTGKSGSTEPTKIELVITRILAAPPGVVFKAWTQREQLLHWWCPKGFTTPSCGMDLRPGGAYRICIRSPEGTDYWMRGVYREVVETERLVYTFAWEEPDGTPGPESLITVTFAEQQGKTKLTFHQAPFESAAERDSHEEGWNECFDRLAAYLARRAGGSAERELVITRVFDAPRHLVWKAWTEPERFKRWWGPKGFTTPFCKIDLRLGGVYLNCMRSPEGKDYWSTGIYREIVPPERIVCTDSFADEEGNVVQATHYGMSNDWPLEMLVTVTFQEQEGKTKLTLRHSGLDGISDADFSDMRQGWSESFDKLAEELKKEVK